MLCDWCKKNEATIHIQQVTPGEKKVVHICSECASAKFQNSLQGSVDPFEIAEMFYEILSRKSRDVVARRDEAEAEKFVRELSLALCPPCTGCGWTISRLQQERKVGCAACYSHFRNVIITALPEFHKGDRHTGKIPGAVAADMDAAVASVRMKLAEAREKLNEAVLREDFEKAAELRDAIALLQEKLESVDRENAAKGMDND